MDDRTRKLIKAYEEAERNDTRVWAGESAYVPGVGTVIMPGTQGGTMAREGAVRGEVNWHQPLPDIVKRTPQQRAESLANRLWASVKDHNPVETELILKMIHQDAWKAGKPISYDDVKKVAADLMRQAAAKAGGPY